MQRRHQRLWMTTAAAIGGLALAGCGSTVRIATTSNQASGSAPNSTAGGGSRAMVGMSMAGSRSGAAPEVNGIRPVASQVLATAYWQGMKIEARTMTPVTFVTVDGSGREHVIRPPRNASFHLMVMLSDQHTGEPIAYAGVWATILDGAGKVVSDEGQWPMDSAYMGPHYGNNVVLPGPGRYTLKLLISPPDQARHMEYAHVWLKQHEVVEHFTWRPTS